MRGPMTSCLRALSAGAQGFATRLHGELRYELKSVGNPATIWRDARRIEKGDAFDQLIREAIASSAILLVVLSENWMKSQYCRKELDCFLERWRHEGEEKLRTRIVVVGKGYVPRDDRPSLLQGQEGYDFYLQNDPDEIGKQYHFFWRGEVRDHPRYVDRVEELGRFLCVVGRSFSAGPATRCLGSPRVPPNGRTIYVATPAGDMREAYGTIVTELQSRGYTVVPDPMKNIPLDSSAIDIIDNAFSAAEASVHSPG